MLTNLAMRYVNMVGGNYARQRHCTKRQDQTNTGAAEVNA